MLKKVIYRGFDAHIAKHRAFENNISEKISIIKG